MKNRMSADATRQAPLLLGLKSKGNASEWTLEGRRESHKCNFQKPKDSETKLKQLQCVQEAFGTH